MTAHTVSLDARDRQPAIGLGRASERVTDEEITVVASGRISELPAVDRRRILRCINEDDELRSVVCTMTTLLAESSPADVDPECSTAPAAPATVVEVGLEIPSALRSTFLGRTSRWALAARCAAAVALALTAYAAITLRSDAPGSRGTPAATMSQTVVAAVPDIPDVRAMPASVQEMLDAALTTGPDESPAAELAAELDAELDAELAALLLPPGGRSPAFTRTDAAMPPSVTPAGADISRVAIRERSLRFIRALIWLKKEAPRGFASYHDFNAIIA